MAKLYSKKKGKSASKKPVGKPSLGWVKPSKEEILSLIEKLAKEGKPERLIGLALRDQYGVPSVKLLVGKTISQVLAEQKLSPKYPNDLLDLIRKAVGLRKHLKEHKRDQANKTKLGHIESKIRRLVKYYRGKKLPAGWKYDAEEAALLVK